MALTGNSVGMLAAQAAKETVIARGLTWGDWVLAGSVFVAGILLGRVVRMGLSRSLRRGDTEVSAADVVGRLVGYVIVLAGLIYALGSLDVRLGPLLGALGIGGIAIAFASQNILSNFIASVLLQVRRPFKRGHQISTNNIDGVVEDVNFRTVVLQTWDGERVLVPCSDVLDNPIVNHTVRGRRRTSLCVGVGYDTDLDRARNILLRIVGSVGGVHPHPEPEVWVECFGDFAVNFAVRFWHAPDGPTMWRVRSDVAVAVKQALDDAGIDMPSPQGVLRVT